LIDREDVLLGSNIELSVNNKCLSGFQLSKKSNCTKYERKVYSKPNEMHLREYSISITPSKLDELDSSREELDKFVKYYFSGMRNSADVNMAIFRVDISKDKLEERHLSMLSQLLQLSSNDIIVPPFLKIANDTKFDSEYYNSMVKTILDDIGPTSTPIACSIPAQASRMDIRSMVDKSGNGNSQIYVVDYDGQKVMGPSNEIMLRTLMKGIRGIEKEYEEGSFVYGYDVRPNPKNGSDKDFVESQLLPAVGLNGVGPKRKRTIITKAIADKIGMMDPLDTKRLFCSEDYRLYSINSGRVTDQFSAFAEDVCGVDYTKLNADEIRNVAVAFTHEERSKVVPELNQSITDNSLLELMESKNTPDKTVKSAQKLAKKVTDE
jgi:hypothetical protein